MILSTDGKTIQLIMSKNENIDSIAEIIKELQKVKDEEIVKFLKSEHEYTVVDGGNVLFGKDMKAKGILCRASGNFIRVVE